MYDFPSSVPRLADRHCSWIPLVAAGISALGSIAGGMMQQEKSEDMANAQMEFQERMSSTAHQREVADLRAAGLNPILSTRHGGASSPSGAMGTAVDVIGNAARAGVSTALAAASTEAQIDQMTAQTHNTKADTDVKQADAYLKREEGIRQPMIYNTTKALQERTEAEASEARERAVNEFVKGQIMREEWTSAKAAATDAGIRDRFLTDNPWVRKLGLTAEQFGKLFGAASSARSAVGR